MVALSGVLVTATPTNPAFPIVSGYTNAQGQAKLPLFEQGIYTLVFSGPAVGRVSNVGVGNHPYTLYTAKNKGTLAMQISGQSVAGGKSLYVFKGSVPVKAIIPSGDTFKSWLPAARFKAPTEGITNIIMPASDVSVSYAVVAATKMLYAINGSNGTVAIATNNAYDPVTNTWTAKANDLSARKILAAGVIDSTLYAIGGYNTADTGTATNTAYDPSTNTWTAKASELTKRTNLAAGVIKSILYAVDGAVSVATNTAYDPSTNTWTAKASDLTGRDSLTAGVIASILYAVDGYKGTLPAYVANNNAYDPSTNTWTAKASDTTARETLQAGVIASKLYALGGYDNTYLTLNHAYDPSTNTWSVKPTGAARAGGVIGVIGSKLYAVDGTSTKLLASNQAYDPSTNTYSTKASDTTKRDGLAAGVMG